MRLRSDMELVEDIEGLTFRSLDDAIVAATKAARGIKSADVRTGKLNLAQQIEIRGPGEQKATIRFSEVLTIRPDLLPVCGPQATA
ncbi:MAG: hypothetical protein ACK4SZ_15425 [Allosphingosinicella sp.]|uniref:hypothetical protein n=1 Tax=Allosphingosinicella sp. TaxID=2823234 RepID=UPI00394D425C